jgi:hypothetical protein
MDAPLSRGQAESPMPGGIRLYAGLIDYLP